MNGSLLMQLLVLDNVRFYKEETKNDPEFAKKVEQRFRKPTSAKPLAALALPYAAK